MSAKEKLNITQQRFCELYASDKEFFGNGVRSYVEAYNIPIEEYNGAKVSACQLLTNPNVLKYISELLTLDGFNDSNVDKQLLFVIEQHIEFGAKVAAIKEYNKLKKRIAEKIELSGVNGNPIEVIDYKKSLIDKLSTIKNDEPK